MFKQIEVIAKLILLKKYSFSSFSKLVSILFFDLITSIPSNIDEININIEGKITLFPKSM